MFEKFLEDDPSQARHAMAAFRDNEMKIKEKRKSIISLSQRRNTTLFTRNDSVSKLLDVPFIDPDQGNFITGLSDRNHFAASNLSN